MTLEQLKEISRICPRWRDRPLAEIVAAVERVQAKPAAIAAHEAQPSPVLAAFDAAIAAELPRVSHVEYDSHEICGHFAAEVRKRLAALETKL